MPIILKSDILHNRKRDIYMRVDYFINKMIEELSTAHFNFKSKDDKK